MDGTNTASIWLALHGVPAGPGVWERLAIPVRAHRFSGIATVESRGEWTLESFVEEILPHYDSQTILLGHDLGAVVAAMAATRKAPRGVVLSGTALGPWWRLTRISGWPVLRYFFYHLFGGRMFLRLGSNRGSGFMDTFVSQLQIPDLPERMRITAENMRPPKNLAAKLAEACPVELIWGRNDIAYPLLVARAISRAIGAPLKTISGGHYCMWEHPEEFAAAMRDFENRLQAEQEADAVWKLSGVRPFRSDGGVIA